LWCQDAGYHSPASLGIYQKALVWRCGNNKVTKFLRSDAGY
jgi:hypothetical protein